MTATPDIDWDDVAVKLKAAFDTMAKVAENQRWDSDRKPYYESMAQIAEALAKTSAEARAVADTKQFSIKKPGA